MAVITISRLTDPRNPRFEPLLRLYEEALPRRERRSEEYLRSAAASPNHSLIVAENDSGLVGFSLLFFDGVAVLEYLATAPEVRGQGLGARLYREVRKDAGDRPMLLEVEAVDPGTPGHELRARRIEFYRRLGARLLRGLDFILPLAGEGAPPPMRLLVDNFDGTAVPKDVVAKWLRENYIRVYGCPGDDPRLERMTASLPPQIVLD